MTLLRLVTNRDVIATLLVESRTPETRLHAAIHFCRAEDVKLLERGHGVLRGRLSGRFTVDQHLDRVTGSRRQLAGVGITGAVLLAYQPDSSSDDDFSAVAGRALGVGMPWVCGAEDAWSRETRSSYWMGTSQRQLYLQGFEEGLRLRQALTVACPACQDRRLYWEPSCTPCDEQRFLQSEQLDLGGYSQTHNHHDLDDQQ